MPELWGGSADLAESNNTTIEDAPSFMPEPTARPTSGAATRYHGRVLHFGIREHGMGAILNGITAARRHPRLRRDVPEFSDYMRGSVRLAALMGLPVTYVWTHDSIGLGEDGPTHQPIEHLAALRAIPGLDVVRPARRQRDGGLLEGDPGAHRPPGRPRPDPAEHADRSPAARTASPTPPACAGAATCCSTPRAARPTWS